MLWFSSVYVSPPDGVVFSVAGSKTWNRTRISHLQGQDKGGVAIENKISNPNRLNVSLDTQVVEPSEKKHRALFLLWLGDASDLEPQKTF